MTGRLRRVALSSQFSALSRAPESVVGYFFGLGRRRKSVESSFKFQVSSFRSGEHGSDFKESLGTCYS